MGVIARVMMLSFMYEGSRPVMMFTFMLRLCIIMLDLLFALVFFRSFLLGFVNGFPLILEFSHHGCYVLGKQIIG